MTLLADRLREFVVGCLEELHTTHLPGFRIPRVFGGHQVEADVRADLAFTLGLLGTGGVSRVAGMPVEDALRTVLAPTDGQGTHTFASYRVAETVARYGPFDGNPLLAQLTAAQRSEIAAACDSLSFLPLLDAGLPRNYAAVLARCEAGRQALGLPIDLDVLDDLTARTRDLLTANSRGYLDDSYQGDGRFDIYTADVYLFTEPLAAGFGDAWTAGAANALRLVESVISRNGAAVTWGRSTGALALCLTVELAGLAACHRLVAEDAIGEWVGRAENAFAHLRTWFPGGLVAAHQYRSTDAYRGSNARLQMTLDCLGKLADAANSLDRLAGRTPLTADRDELVWFDESRNSGVWSYRSRDLAFVLPLVGGSLSEYLAAPRNPGLFEVPVDSDLVTGLPMAIRHQSRFTPAGLPVSVRKVPHGIEVEHIGWVQAGQLDVPADRPVLGGRRRATYQVEGATLRVAEDLRFDTVPDALSLQVAETTDRPLNVRFETTGDDHVTTVDTSGLTEYRSSWAELPAVHQVDLEPTSRVRFRWSVSPRLRIMTTAHFDAYDASLYEPLAGRIVHGPTPQEVYWGDTAALDGWDQFHLHWPEYLYWPSHPRLLPDHIPPCEPSAHRALIALLQENGVKIVWTQHNLVPHHRIPNDEEVYAQWAAAADTVIHHSEYGKARVLERYAFGEHTRHWVIPHGHAGNPLPEDITIQRQEVEKSLGLRPGVLRLAVIGAPRREKRADLVMEAVAASARDDIELLVLSSARGRQVPDDPRIVAFPYDHVPQEEYNRRLAAIDVLVMPFDEGMLTTGTVGDVVGAGLPALVSSWPFLTEYLGDAGICYGSSAEDLRRCIDGLDEAQLRHAREAAVRLRPVYDWKRVAELHLAVLEDLGTAKL
ncbi:hypothetical protein [Streptomyces coffeae]|uniref:Glycosyltransferase n=1 Tax=Streptomyces coffeae TaxID=621382 RepID=A0ABS1NPX6_9ACTN|nr:hypothetical protein [Streptomyces coffeae]MBL1102147.1 hypothetical protein [Streptomyces coffeae]